MCLLVWQGERALMRMKDGWHEFSPVLNRQAKRLWNRDYFWYSQSRRNNTYREDNLTPRGTQEYLCILKLETFHCSILKWIHVFPHLVHVLKWIRLLTWGTRKKDSFGRWTSATGLPRSEGTVLETRCFSTALSGAPITTSLTDAIFVKRACLCSTIRNRYHKNCYVAMGAM